MVTCDPSEDGRTFGGQTMSGTSAGGVMLMGALSTTTDGKLSSLTAYTLSSGADPADLSSWSLASFSADGNPVIPMTFAGASQPNTIAVDLGISNYDDTQGVGTWIGSRQTAAEVGTSMLNLPEFRYRTISALATTSYSTGSSTIYHGQDGYADGTLLSVTVDERGTIIGHYSNNQSCDLFTAGLATFTNEMGLRRQGGNLYAASTDSGDPTYGQPASGSLGSILGKSLEGSNVDMAQGMLDLILAQRGFQANTKIISTVDSLLNTALQLKR
jgi:flagellar hook protein FlgE